MTLTARASNSQSDRSSLCWDTAHTPAGATSPGGIGGSPHWWWDVSLTCWLREWTRPSRKPGQGWGTLTQDAGIPNSFFTMAPSAHPKHVLIIHLRICIQGEIIIEFNYPGVIQFFVYSILSAGMSTRRQSVNSPWPLKTQCLKYIKSQYLLVVVFFFLISPAFIKLMDLHSSISLFIKVKSLRIQGKK